MDRLMCRPMGSQEYMDHTRWGHQHRPETRWHLLGGERAEAGVRPAAGATIGAILAGIEQQILRTQPPAHELVHHARPDAPIPAKDGGHLLVVLPPGPQLPETDAEREDEDVTSPGDQPPVGPPPARITTTPRRRRRWRR